MGKRIQPVQTHRYKRFLKNHLPVDTFEELDTPLTVVATDLQKAVSTYIGKGELLPAFLAQLCPAGIFSSTNYEWKSTAGTSLKTR